MRVIPLLLATWLLSMPSPAQTRGRGHPAYTPFHDVRVLDNRVDSIAYTSVGTKGAVRYIFGNRTGDSIRLYLEKKLARRQRGDRHLVIDIDELHFLGRSSNFWVSAACYDEVEDDKYRMICSIDTGFGWFIGYKHFSDIHSLLDCMLVAASAGDENIGRPTHAIPTHAIPPTRGWKNQFIAGLAKKCFVYPTAGPVLSLAEIDKPESEKWSEYPILRQGPGPDGIYSSFYDFRAALVRQEKLYMVFDAADSVYTLSPDPSDTVGKGQVFPWAVACKGELFIRVGSTENKYLKLDRRVTTFNFRIPRTMPDMGSLVALEKIAEQQGGGGGFEGNAGGGGGSADAAFLGVGIVAAVVRAGILGARTSKITENGLNCSDRRTCRIDMSCGDILYF